MGGYRASAVRRFAVAISCSKRRRLHPSAVRMRFELTGARGRLGGAALTTTFLTAFFLGAAFFALAAFFGADFFFLSQNIWVREKSTVFSPACQVSCAP